MFLKAGHDFHEIAGHMAVVELILQDQIPSIPAGAGRAGEAKNVFSPGDAGGGARLNRRCADLAMGNEVEDDGEPFDFLFEERTHRLDSDVKTGETGAAGRYHHIDVGVLEPGPQLAADGRDAVLDKRADRKSVV